jgi:hypothetical protein
LRLLKEINRQQLKAIPGSFFGVNGKIFKDSTRHLSTFSTWEPKEHAHQWIIYPENIGTHLAIDEVVLSQGELYTIVTTNKKAKAKGSLVAIVAGTKQNK